jgi:hypothetical protein
MPYYIEEGPADCKSGWATTDSNGKTISCHETKDQAIKQMVAISLSTGEEPGGDWKNRKKK